MASRWDGIHHAEGTRDPWSTKRMTKILSGVDRMRLPETIARRALNPPSFALTPQVIGRLIPLMRISADGLMLQAAVLMAVSGMLRPAEFLGNRTKLPITRGSIMFEPSVDGAPPARYSINLGSTKADQMGTNAPVLVANTSAVLAMWEWMRSSSGRLDAPLFVRNKRPLASTFLLKYLRGLLGLAGIPFVKLTGKTFRRGGASHLLASGATRSDIAAMGRWKTFTMIEVYSSAESKEARIASAAASFGSADASSSVSSSSYSSSAMFSSVSTLTSSAVPAPVQHRRRRRIDELY